MTKTEREGSVHNQAMHADAGLERSGRCLANLNTCRFG